MVRPAFKKEYTKIVRVENIHEYIDAAITTCGNEIANGNHCIFNEADFERVLSFYLEEKLHNTNFSVHNQLKCFYRKNGKEKYKKPDITLLDEEDFYLDKKDSDQKSYIYNERRDRYKLEKPSVSFELKFFHGWDTSKKGKVEEDIIKKAFLDDGSHSYIVVLVDNINNIKKEDIQDDIDSIGKKHFLKDYNSSLFGYALIIKTTKENEKDNKENK